MQYRRLGSTNLEVSQVSFGGIRLGNLTQDETNQIIHGAINGGMNYIDTARLYGDSEERLGGALKDGWREKVIISSKAARRDLEGFHESVALSMKLLQTSYLDILFAHDVSTIEGWNQIQNNGIIDYMNQLKKDGKIRHLACSTHDEGIGKLMIESGYFEVVMLAYNPANPELEDTLIPLAKSKDMGIVIMKPFGGGVLTEVRSREMGFEITAEECLRFGVSNPDVSAVIPGLDQMGYLETALKIGDVTDFLTAEEKADIIKKVTIRGKNYCRGCGYCLPCPKNIPIPTVLGLLNRMEIFDGIDWNQTHNISVEYKNKVDSSCSPDNCISCNACSTRCPYNLPISSLMKTAANKLS